MACSAPGCRSRSNVNCGLPTGISFHRFPKQENIFKQWIHEINRPNWYPTRNSRVCSRHFALRCYKKGRLLRTAVPTIFPDPVPSKRSSGKRKSVANNNEEPPNKVLKLNITPQLRPPNENNVQPNQMSEAEARYVHLSTSQLNVQPNQMSEAEARYVHTSTSQLNINFDDSTMTTLLIEKQMSKALKEKVRSLEFELTRTKRIADRRKRKLHASHQRYYRLVKKTSVMAKTIKELKDEIKKKDLSKRPNEIVSRYLMKLNGLSLPKEYSEEIKQFAITLQFLSPRAYNYVRSILNDILPHPKTLSRWYQSVNCEPGFTKEAFDILKLRCRNSERTLYCALSMDEMAIRRQREWDGKKYYGHIYSGSDEEGEKTPLASEILTFVVTAINERWKIPVGYFPVNGLSGDQKCNLVKQCIHLLNKTGIKTVSLTFDGAASNGYMAAELGCNLETNNLKTSFKVDDHDVAILYDPCHNIKLVRNALADKKILRSGSKEITWKCIEDLHHLQDKEGLHAANKLTAAHVNFEKQKMKVKLATQLFSRSVADALAFCQQLGIDEFLNCNATIEFIRNFNDLFDIMNSKNLSDFGYKKALYAQNIDNIKLKLSELSDYLDSLKLVDGSLITQSRRKTGFVGFKICIQSILEIYDRYLIENPSLFFLPVYKLSQDHVEIFFSSIRSLGGYNNNPSVKSFKTAYKKLLVHAEFKISKNGNCLPLEDITILHSSNINRSLYMENINNTSERANMCEERQILDNIDHDYIPNPSTLSEFYNNVIEYVAGFVVRKIEKKISCEPCREVLFHDEPIDLIHCSLIKSKNRGGLIELSSNVVKICKETEQSFRYYLSSLGPGNVGTPRNYFKIVSEVFSVCGNLFNHLDSHGNQHYILDNHRHNLIKSIIDLYLKIRIHHECKKSSTPKEYIRNFLNKTILFKGQ